jgi:hypothetical protein
MISEVSDIKTQNVFNHCFIKLDSVLIFHALVTMSLWVPLINCVLSHKCRGGLTRSSRLKETSIYHDMRPFLLLLNDNFTKSDAELNYKQLTKCICLQRLSFLPQTDVGK